MERRWSWSLPERVALAIISAALFAAGVAHWRLRFPKPVFSSRCALDAVAGPAPLRSPSQPASRPAPQPAARVLQSNAALWRGSVLAAPVHEALGRLHLSRGDAAAALEAFERAVRPAEALEPSAPGWAAAAALRVRVAEAELRLQAGDLDAAIGAVAQSIEVEAVGSAKVRARALAVLVRTVVRMRPSAEELQAVHEKFQSLGEESAKWHDLDARALICEASAELREARGLEGLELLQEALRLRERQRSLLGRLGVPPGAP